MLFSCSKPKAKTLETWCKNCPKPTTKTPERRQTTDLGQANGCSELIKSYPID